MTFLKISKKLLKYYSGTAIFTFLNTLLLLSAVDFPMKLDLYLKDIELSVETFSGFSVFVRGDSCILNCHKGFKVSEQLSLYSIKLYIDIRISWLSAPSMCSSFMWVMHFVNGAQLTRQSLLFKNLVIILWKRCFHFQMISQTIYKL